MQTGVCSVTVYMYMYGCESWAINADDRNRLNAFEMDIYGRMMRISCTDHRTNNSILEELELKPACWLLAEIDRRKLKYFGRVVRADDFCTHALPSLPETDAEEDRGDVGRTISSNGHEHRLQTVFTVQPAKGRSAWRAIVSVSVTSDPQTRGRT